MLVERVDYIGGGEIAAGHASWVEPQPHGILALAKNKNLAYALDALKGIADIYVEIIADEQAVVLIVIGEETRAKDKSGGALADADAGGLH